MKPSKSVTSVVIGAVLLGGHWVYSPRALALDLTSYGAATAFLVKANTLKKTVHADSERSPQHEEYLNARTAGAVFLGLGLAVDAVGLLFLASGFDRVETMDVEIANGGGPITDSLAQSFGVSTREALAAMQGAVEAAGHQDLSTVNGVLAAELMLDGGFSEPLAGEILFGLYNESTQPDLEPMRWHQALAEASGVPLAELKPTVRTYLYEQLNAYDRGEYVVSARAVLAQDSAATLRELLGRVYDAHTSAVESQMTLVYSGAPAL